MTLDPSLHGHDISPLDAATHVASGTLVLVDVRPSQERELATIPVKFITLDQGSAALEAFPKDTALAFVCHHGSRSANAAEYFRRLGFTRSYNVAGGIDAWAGIDPTVPRY